VEPVGPWVVPGRYLVELTVNGRTFSQTLDVDMDPRVTTSPAAIRRQFGLSMRLYRALGESFEALTSARRLRAQSGNQPEGREAAELEATFARLNRELGSLENIVEDADVEPTSQVVEAIFARERSLEEAIALVRALETRMNR
jgi:hypothetical protein